MAKDLDSGNGIGFDSESYFDGWYFLDHSGGGAIRCKENSFTAMECLAKSDGSGCWWGLFSDAH